MSFKRRATGNNDSEIKVVKGWTPIKMVKATHKVFASGSEKIGFTVKDLDTQEIMFFDVFTVGKNGAINFGNRLVNAMLDIAKISDEDLDEYGLQATLKDERFYILTDVEEDEYKGETKRKNRLMEVFGLDGLDSRGEVSTYWSEQLDVSNPAKFEEKEEEETEEEDGSNEDGKEVDWDSVI